MDEEIRKRYETGQYKTALWSVTGEFVSVLGGNNGMISIRDVAQEHHVVPVDELSEGAF